jgi:hypothetical protein
MEATLMIRPDPRATMPGITACARPQALTTRVIRKSAAGPGPGRGGEALGDREAGVVDQHVHVASARGDGVQDRLVRVEQAKVLRNGEGLDAVVADKLGRQGLKPVGPSAVSARS